MEFLTLAHDITNQDDVVKEQLTGTQKALLDSYRHGVLEQQRRELEQRMEIAVKESEDKVTDSSDWSCYILCLMCCH